MASEKQDKAVIEVETDFGGLPYRFNSVQKIAALVEAAKMGIALYKMFLDRKKSFAVIIHGFTFEKLSNIER